MILFSSNQVFSMKEENPPFKLVGIAILSDRPQFLSMSRRSGQEKQEQVGEPVSIPRWALETGWMSCVRVEDGIPWLQDLGS